MRTRSSANGLSAPAAAPGPSSRRSPRTPLRARLLHVAPTTLGRASSSRRAVDSPAARTPHQVRRPRAPPFRARLGRPCLSLALVLSPRPRTLSSLLLSSAPPPSALRPPSPRPPHRTTRPPPRRPPRDKLPPLPLPFHRSPSAEDMPATIEVKDVGVPQISLRDFDARRDEIRQQLMDAASDVGFLCVSSSSPSSLPRPLPTSRSG